MALLDLPARELLDRFASTDPTPGGGSAAALAGAMGAALAAMVCGLPKTRTGSPEERARLDTALAWAREAGVRLRRLVDEDARAYEAVLGAYRLPKVTEDEKEKRRKAVSRALDQATDVPLETAEACLVALNAAREARDHGNPNASSDALTAGALAVAGILAALENVKANAASREGLDPALADKERALWSQAQEASRALGLPLALES